VGRREREKTTMEKRRGCPPNNNAIRIRRVNQTKFIVAGRGYFEGLINKGGVREEGGTPSHFNPRVSKGGFTRNRREGKYFKWMGETWQNAKLIGSLGKGSLPQETPRGKGGGFRSV